jgi:Spy/CpxP family protein refolding chaperone
VKARLAATIVAAILVGSATFATTANAQLLDIPPGKWWKRPRVVEMLKLQPEQQDRLEEVFAKNRRSFIDLRADVERRQIDLEELLAKKDADLKKIGLATEAHEQAKARLGKARTMMIVEMRAVLTEAQWQKVVEARDQWKRERLEGLRRPGPPRERGMGRRAPDAAPPADQE